MHERSGVVILAGGKNTRMIDYADGVPKCALPLPHGYSGVQGLATELRLLGIDFRIAIAERHRDVFRSQLDALGLASNNYLVSEASDLGTFGSFAAAVSTTQWSRALVVNADTIVHGRPSLGWLIGCSVPLGKVGLQICATNASQNQGFIRLGRIGDVVTTGEDRRIFSVEDRRIFSVIETLEGRAIGRVPLGENITWTSPSGIYLFDMPRLVKWLKHRESRPSSLELQVVPMLVSESRLAALQLDEPAYIHDVGNPVEFERLWNLADTEWSGTKFERV